MKIEGDYLIFSSGKKLYSTDGYVSIDNEGGLLIEEGGQADGRYTPELTEQEQWELARYMIERWIDVRDKLWARHEETMRAEPVETPKPLPLEKMDGPFKGGHGLEEMKVERLTTSLTTNSLYISREAKEDKE